MSRTEPEYIVQLGKIASCFEEPWVPLQLANRTDVKAEDWTFTIRPCTEADIIAEAQFCATLQSPFTEEEREILADGRRLSDPTRNREVLREMSRQDRVLRFWRFRRWVTPPKPLADMWRATVSIAEADKDPMIHLPKEIWEGLETAILNKVTVSTKLVTEGNPCPHCKGTGKEAIPDAAENAAGKS